MRQSIVNRGCCGVCLRVILGGRYRRLRRVGTSIGHRIRSLLIALARRRNHLISHLDISVLVLFVILFIFLIVLVVVIFVIGSL